MDKLLIVDDSVPFLNDMESLLSDYYDILKATNGKSALRLLQVETVMAVLLDLKLPDIDGIEVLKRIHDEIDPLLPVIIVTDYGEAENAVKAMRNGAFDFIPKAFNIKVLAEKILKALEHRELKLKADLLQESFISQQNQYIFHSPIMKNVYYKILQVAKNDFDVLLIGETGVGKDLTAFEIHRHSPRKDYPFVPILITSLNESLIESELFGHEKGAFTGATSTKIGKLEAADGGTLYLPEISALSEKMQIKLLHFMQYKTISRVGQNPKKSPQKLDVRLIMATNENLQELVRKGHLREDFYYRISGVKLEIPPLRERKEEIEALVKYFMRKYTPRTFDQPMKLDPAVIELFLAYSWPGNVRELENTIKSAIAFARNDALTVNDFPSILQAVHSLPANNTQKISSGTGELNKTKENDGNMDNSRQSSGFILSEGEMTDMMPFKEAERRFKRIYFTKLLARCNGNISEAARLAGITPQGLRKALRNLGIKGHS